MATKTPLHEILLLLLLMVRLRLPRQENIAGAQNTPSLNMCKGRRGFRVPDRKMNQRGGVPMVNRTPTPPRHMAASLCPCGPVVPVYFLFFHPTAIGHVALVCSWHACYLELRSGVTL